MLKQAILHILELHATLPDSDGYNPTQLTELHRQQEKKIPLGKGNKHYLF